MIVLRYTSIQKRPYLGTLLIKSSLYVVAFFVVNQREKQSLLENSGQMSDKTPPEIEIDKEIDKEIEI